MQRGTAPDVRELFAKASSLHQAGRLAEAERLYRQILDIDRRHADTLHLLGVIAFQVGRYDAAVTLITQAIAQNGKVPSFHNNLGNALAEGGKLDDAAACYVQAIFLKPDYAEAHYNLGVALQAQGKLDAAATSYRRALAYKPNHAAAGGNLGNVLQEQGKPEEAIAAYRKALSHQPNYAEAYGNLANVYKAQGRLAEATAAYAQALSLKPQYAEAHNNLGLVLLEQGKLEDAVASFERAVSLKQDYAEAHSNLGGALREQGKRHEALSSYGRALAVRPDFAEARLGLAVAAIPLFVDTEAESVAASDEFARALTELFSWDAAHPGMLGKAAGITQPFYLAYRPQNLSGLLRRYGELLGAAANAYWLPSADTGLSLRRDAVAPGRRIRVVMVSGQVRRHPVWDVILRGLIAHIDRQKFEVMVFHTGALVDEETRWARDNVDRFVQGPRSMKGWIEEIATAKPDVLFYPEVGMDPAGGALAALRLAPLQIAGWGHPITTGLPSMDIFLSGELLEGRDADRHYRERLVRLPGTGVCMEPTRTPAQSWQGPARIPGVVRFALCQQPIKFDPADDALLARIAKAVGPCEFWLVLPHKHDWAARKLRDRLSRAFRAEGLDAGAHLRVANWMPEAEFLGFLDDMDMLLDCPAFSGYTTACAALHQGLPIVTVEGEFLRQRLAAGLLRQAGCPEGIAASRNDYEDIAIRWARESRDRQGWSARRASIREEAARADGNGSVITAFEKVLRGG
jgi:predicted O-linked N-acetylglucosamine transferase (SPINDLY family)